MMNRSTPRTVRDDSADTLDTGMATATSVSVAPAESIDHVPHDPDSATAWMAEGNCRLHPPAMFFPSDGVGVDRARKICASCPVIDTCLEFALAERIEHGVWGGCSERERRRILKRRRVELAN